MTFVSCQHESITGPYNDDSSLKAQTANGNVEPNASGGNRGRRRGAGAGNAATKVLQVEGLVRSATATEVVVFSSKGAEVTIVVNDATVIRHGQEPIAAADLQVDWRVHAKVKSENDQNVALEIIVQNRNGDDDDDSGDDNGGATTLTANGAVKSVSGTTLVVNSQSKGEVTVKTDASTIIKKQGQRITVADIKAGDEANCRGNRTGEREMLAVQIEVRGKSKR
ncbi:MAG TPA: DUF5666 domain-containing protein [Thermoanaerobaculia bacterium]